MSEKARNFNNPYPSYDSSVKLLDENGKICDEYYSEIFDYIYDSTCRFIKNSAKIPSTFRSVYIGMVGICFALDKLWKFSKKYSTKFDDQVFSQCKMLLESFVKKLKPVDSDSFSFLEGVSGYYCFMIMFYYPKDQNKCQSLLDELIQLFDKKRMECKNKTHVDEVLYGRAGYLYALIYIINNTNLIISPSVLSSICSSIIESGKQLPPHPNMSAPLNYSFHDTYYLGAAHGYVGILYMLLDKNVRELDVVNNQIKLILDTVDALFNTVYSSGNLPSSLPRHHDKLVQWCHGSPGAIYLAIRCYKITGKEKYLDIAKKFADDIWKRGILTKSIGLCHGVAGNAYAFLAMYNCTKNEQYLHYALMFAKWISLKHQYYQDADRPMSLHEGISGVIYFLIDLYDPSHALFPGFQTCID